MEIGGQVAIAWIHIFLLIEMGNSYVLICAYNIIDWQNRAQAASLLLIKDVNMQLS